jgi:penicillin-binding protein 1C
MGGNIYGVEAASRVYFGIAASDLNLAQAALLAAIPNNPNYLNPYQHWGSLKKRQRYVLKRMVREGYITQRQAEEIYSEEIPLQPRQQGIIAAPHFLFWVANQLPSDHPPQIRTTIDRPLQQFVEAQVRDIVASLTNHNVNQAAVLVIDNHTGEVLAYIGSTDYFSDVTLGRNDGVQALRQPGSTLKPFLYQLALEKRLILPNTVLADVPTHYAIPGAKLYSPTDYNETFTGPVRVRIALANSLNVPAVRVLEKVGVANFLNRLHQLGFEHLKQDPEYYGLGLTLGSGEVTLWELARAYYIMAQQGQIRQDFRKSGRENGFLSPGVSPINQDLQRNPFSEGENGFPSPGVSPTSHKSWGVIRDILSDRHARAKSFGVDSILNLPFPAAVKTGTSSNFRDTWTVGFSTDYTVATWVGNFSGESMEQVSGVTGAAPLWERIMLRLHENQEPAPFPPPPGMVKRPICALSGLKPTSACPSIVQEYFALEDLPDYESHPDTFYQKVTDGSTNYRLNLPKDYDEWLAKQPASTVISSNLRILSPQNGDSFLLEETGLGEQKLQFKIGGLSEKPVEWRLNGEKLASNKANSLFWKLQPGQWTLEVRSGSLKDQVSFAVKLGAKKTTKRGFSLGKN